MLVHLWFVLWEKLALYTPTAMEGLMIARQAGRPADEIWVDFEIFEILYNIG